MKYLCLALVALLFVSGEPKSISNRHWRVGYVPEPIAIDKNMLTKFYELNHHQLFWFGAQANASLLRCALKESLDTAVYFGLRQTDYHYREILELVDNRYGAADSIGAMKADRLFTDAALRYCGDILAGNDNSRLMSSDMISPNYALRDANFVINNLRHANTDTAFNALIRQMELADPAYVRIKHQLIVTARTGDSVMTEKLATTLNQLRRISHFHFASYIVINIPSATLQYYDSGRLQLTMRVVVGKPSSRTPRFSAFCDQVVLYPYWNVPHTIAVNELLPLFRRVPGLLQTMNMEVLDRNEKIVPANDINWKAYSKSNFPYRIRQATGCENALGVLKFNLNSPFDVYMHDTNVKASFKSVYRFYSHGCIRLEHPVQLANRLLKNRLDSNLLASCLKNQRPIPIRLDSPMPVFVDYMSVGLEQDQLIFYKDIYKLIKGQHIY